MLLSDPEPAALLDAMAAWRPPQTRRWVDA